MKISDVNYYVARGIFYGYSQDSIANFIFRCYCVDNNQSMIGLPTSIGTPFEYLGWIPSEEELAMNPQDVIDLINKRRTFSVPLGVNAEDADPEDIEFGRYVIKIMRPGVERKLVQSMAASIILKMIAKGYSIEEDM